MIHKENGGVMSARRAGIAAATGEYIGFADGDDYVEPDMYEFLYQLITSNHADIAQCGFYSEKNGVLSTRADDELYVFTGREAVHRLCRGEIAYGVLWNKLYKRRLLEKANLSHDIVIAEDRLSNFHLFCAAKRVVFHNAAKYIYVTRNNSVLRRPYPVKWIVDEGICTQTMLKESENTALWPWTMMARLSYCLSHAMYILHTSRNEEYYDKLVGEVRANIGFLVRYRKLFSRADRIKAILLLTNRQLAKWVYDRHRDR